MVRLRITKNQYEQIERMLDTLLRKSPNFRAHLLADGNEDVTMTGRTPGADDMAAAHALREQAGFNKMTMPLGTVWNVMDVLLERRGYDRSFRRAQIVAHNAGFRSSLRRARNLQ